MRGLAEWINKANDFEGGLNLILQLKGLLVGKFQEGNMKDDIRWDCWNGILLCCVYVISFSLKVGRGNEYIFKAMEQLKFPLISIIDEAKKEDEEPDVSFESDIYELFIKMIPQIEASGDKELICQACEFARDYYEVTQRPILAERYSRKLKHLQES